MSEDKGARVDIAERAQGAGEGLSASPNRATPSAQSDLSHVVRKTAARSEAPGLSRQLQKDAGAHMATVKIAPMDTAPLVTAFAMPSRTSSRIRNESRAALRMSRSFRSLAISGSHLPGCGEWPEAA